MSLPVTARVPFGGDHVPEQWPGAGAHPAYGVVVMREDG